MTSRKKYTPPSWFDLDEVRKKGMDAVAKEHGIKIDTVRRTLNKMGYSSKDFPKKVPFEKGEEEEVAVKKEVPERKETTSIGGISKDTFTNFKNTKDDWEGRLDRKVDNDFFLQLLLAIAKLLER